MKKRLGLKVLTAFLLVAALMLSLCSCLDLDGDIFDGNWDDDGFVAQPDKDKETDGEKQTEIESESETRSQTEAETRGESTELELPRGKGGDGSIDIHFIELGNKYTGDCTYIKAGNNDILIDAGSRTSSIDDIDDYLSQYVDDGILEFVIVTHAHQDHFAGFATSANINSLFDLYECEVIIDFSQITAGREDKTMYKNYIRERDDEIAAGAKHFTAAECVELGGVIDLGGGVTMTVLDSYFYYNRSSDENNHSVCTMFDDGTNKYLFTGDLELEGEEKLVELNELSKVKLFKAGHHGSKTSSNDVLLSVIQPEIVCVCCCCGSPEYTDTPNNQFPTQAFINRIAPYTDRVYVTTLCVDYDSGQYRSMNGDITVSSTAGAVSVICSASTDVLKDSQWFKENRTVPPAWRN